MKVKFIRYYKDYIPESTGKQECIIYQLMMNITDVTSNHLIQCPTCTNIYSLYHNVLVDDENKITITGKPLTNSILCIASCKAHYYIQDGEVIPA